MMNRAVLIPACLLIAGLLVRCSDDEDSNAPGVADAGFPNADTGESTNPDAGFADDDAGEMAGEDTGTNTDAGQGDGGFMPPSFGQWEQYEPPGAFCANGSQYKFFVNFSETSDNVIIFFEGGGACWDYRSCTGTGVRSATNRDGIRDNYAASLVNFNGIPISADQVYPLMNPDPSVSPMSDWNKVFVPYCTGDVFSGTQTVTYTDPDGEGDDIEFSHLGHSNVLAMIEMLSDMFPMIGRMFVSGCSAGGAGAINNYYFLRSGLNPEQGFLLNDSGPIFPDQAATAWSLPLHDRVRQAWGVDTTINQIPMAIDILTDFGALNSVLSTLFPNDRLAQALFRLDYNYSLYSYERFYEVNEEGQVVLFGTGEGLDGLGLNEEDPVDRAAVYRLLWDDIDLLRTQYDQRNNLGYFMPFYRDTNDSHCTTIPGLDEFPPNQILNLLLNDFGTLAWAGTEIPTEGGEFNLRDYVEDLLDVNAPMPSFFEIDGEGRYLACTPDPRYTDVEACAMAQ